MYFNPIHALSDQQISNSSRTFLGGKLKHVASIKFATLLIEDFKQLLLFSLQSVFLAALL